MSNRAAVAKAAGVPTYLRRRIAWLVGASIVLGLIVIPVSMFGQRALPIWAYVLAIAVPGSMNGFIWWWYGIALDREQKRAGAADGRVCWHCGYSLEGIGATGTCPECGRAFDTTDLRRKWVVPTPPQPAPTPAA